VRLSTFSSFTYAMDLPGIGHLNEMANGKDKQKQRNDPMYYVQFGYLLNRAGSLGAACMSDVLKEFDIPLPIWQILLVLSEFNEQTISELASHTGIEMSYLSRTVLKAEQLGFVTRAKSTKDRRVTYIKLSTGGRQMIRKVLPTTRRLLKIIFQGVPYADIETTGRTLKVVYDNLASNADAMSVDVNRKLIVAQRTGKYGNKSESV
jgi:DNA-binding MarR family transcriptional regulator